MDTQPAPRRVLIVRLSALGDVAMASGLIPALRAAWPEARLSWLVEPPAADLLRHNPHLDEVLVWPKQQWRELWRAGRYRALGAQVRDFRRMLRGRRFDLALDTQGLLKSALLGWAGGARRRVGIGSREGSRWLMHDDMTPRRDDPRMSSEYRQLVTHLGLDESRFEMDIAVSDGDRDAVATRLAALGLDGPYCVLCPFTTRPQKHWFEDRWRGLAEALYRRLGLRPVILGGPGDEPAAARILAGIAPDCGALSLAGATRLGEAAACIRASRLLVGVDTGLTHIGIGFGVPSLALFGSTRPYLDTGRASARVLYHPLPCSPCRRHPTCDGRFDCMRLHTVENVTEAAARLSAGHGLATPA